MEVSNGHLAEAQLPRPELEALQRRKLAELWPVLVERNPFYRSKFANLGFAPLSDALPDLPLTTRAEIQADQETHPPYGTRLSHGIERYHRLHQTSGTSGAPLRVLDTPTDWAWWYRCWDHIYAGAGITEADRFLFPFSFGPFIGFWAAFEAACAQGNLCLPAGGMSTTARLAFIADHGVTVICCTPTYALRMAEVAAAEGMNLASSTVRALIVAGEPGGSVPSVRARIEQAYGARVLDHVGMSEVGPWGFESVDSPGKVHVIESEFIAEVIDPQRGTPVADGEAGELVLTALGRIGHPLVRYRTGDRVTLHRDPVGAHSRFAWVDGGVRGRSDDMVVVRGNNVFPSAIEGILRGFDAVAEFRLLVTQRGALNDLCIEVEPHAGGVQGDLAGLIADAVRDQLHFACAVRLVEPGTLPRFEMKGRRLIRAFEDETS